MPVPARDGVWIALVTATSVLFSLTLACATPFAAIATIAGLALPRRNAAVLVLTAWLINQGVGFLVLGYPRTWDAPAWGVVIGFAAIVSMLAASEIARRAQLSLLTWGIAFLVAFVTYQGVLFAATAILPSWDEAFSLPVMRSVFFYNLLGLVGLLLLHRLAIAFGLLDLEPELSGARYRRLAQS